MNEWSKEVVFFKQIVEIISSKTHLIKMC